MKNIFALFVIFAGIINPLTVLGIPETTLPPGYEDVSDIENMEGYNPCEGKCSEAKNPCPTKFTGTPPSKCKQSTDNATGYLFKNYYVCSGNLEGTNCQWKEASSNANTDPIKLVRCKPGYYFDSSIQLSPSDDLLKHCTTCPEPDFGVRDKAVTITDISGATSPAECYVPGPITTDASDENKCKDAGGFWFDNKCYEIQSDNPNGKTSNKFILIDDCHHNDYVAPATPASDE